MRNPAPRPRTPQWLDPPERTIDNHSHEPISHEPNSIASPCRHCNHPETDYMRFVDFLNLFWAVSRKLLTASHFLQVAGERGPLGMSEPWIWRTSPERGAFSEQRGMALRRLSERAAISSGKHGPSLRSIGLPASRARLILQRRHGVIRVKSPPWSCVARRAPTGHLQEMGRS